MGETDPDDHHKNPNDGSEGWGEASPAKLAPGFSGLEAREYRPGSRPGAGYVRLVRNPRAQFRYLGEGLLEATPEANAARSGFGKFSSGVRRVLIGQPLASSQAIHERLS
ncbi:MAG: hypothetical protein ACRDGF_02445, partial [Chloroflexota bacterium]